MGCIGLAGGTFFVWSPLRAVPKGGAIPDKVAQGILESPLDPLGGVDSVYLLLVVMPMRMTQWCLSPPDG